MALWDSLNTTLSSLITAHQDLDEDQHHQLLSYKEVTRSRENLFGDTDRPQSATDAPVDFQNVTTDSTSSIAFLGKRVTREYKSEFVLPNDVIIAVSRRECFLPAEGTVDVQVSLATGGPESLLSSVAADPLRITNYLCEDPWACSMLTYDRSQDSDLLKQIKANYTEQPERFRVERSEKQMFKEEQVTMTQRAVKDDRSLVSRMRSHTVPQSQAEQTLSTSNGVDDKYQTPERADAAANQTYVSQPHVPTSLNITTPKTSAEGVTPYHTRPEPLQLKGVNSLAVDELLLSPRSAQRVRFGDVSVENQGFIIKRNSGDRTKNGKNGGFWKRKRQKRSKDRSEDKSKIPEPLALVAAPVSAEDVRPTHGMAISDTSSGSSSFSSDSEENEDIQPVAEAQSHTPPPQTEDSRSTSPVLVFRAVPAVGAPCDTDDQLKPDTLSDNRWVSNVLHVNLNVGAGVQGDQSTNNFIFSSPQVLQPEPLLITGLNEPTPSHSQVMSVDYTPPAAPPIVAKASSTEQSKEMKTASTNVQFARVVTVNEPRTPVISAINELPFVDDEDDSEAEAIKIQQQAVSISEYNDTPSPSSHNNNESKWSAAPTKHLYHSEISSALKYFVPEEKSTKEKPVVSPAVSDNSFSMKFDFPLKPVVPQKSVSTPSNQPTSSLQSPAQDSIDQTDSSRPPFFKWSPLSGGLKPAHSNINKTDLVVKLSPPDVRQDAKAPEQSSIPGSSSSSTSTESSSESDEESGDSYSAERADSVYAGMIPAHRRRTLDSIPEDSSNTRQLTRNYFGNADDIKVPTVSLPSQTVTDGAVTDTVDITSIQKAPLFTTERKESFQTFHQALNVLNGTPRSGIDLESKEAILTIETIRCPSQDLSQSDAAADVQPPIVHVAVPTVEDLVSPKPTLRRSLSGAAPKTTEMSLSTEQHPLPNLETTGTKATSEPVSNDKLPTFIKFDPSPVAVKAQLSHPAVKPVQPPTFDQANITRHPAEQQHSPELSTSSESSSEASSSESEDDAPPVAAKAPLSRPVVLVGQPPNSDHTDLTCQQALPTETIERHHSPELIGSTDSSTEATTSDSDEEKIMKWNVYRGSIDSEGLVEVTDLDNITTSEPAKDLPDEETLDEIAAESIEPSKSLAAYAAPSEHPSTDYDPSTDGAVSFVLDIRGLLQPWPPVTDNEDLPGYAPALDLHEDQWELDTTSSRKPIASDHPDHVPPVIRMKPRQTRTPTPLQTQSVDAAPVTTRVTPAAQPAKVMARSQNTLTAPTNARAVDRKESFVTPGAVDSTRPKPRKRSPVPSDIEPVSMPVPLSVLSPRSGRPSRDGNLQHAAPSVQSPRPPLISAQTLPAIDRKESVRVLGKTRELQRSSQPNVATEDTSVVMRRPGATIAGQRRSTSSAEFQPASIPSDEDKQRSTLSNFAEKEGEGHSGTTKSPIKRWFAKHMSFREKSEFEKSPKSEQKVSRRDMPDKDFNRRNSFTFDDGKLTKSHKKIWPFSKHRRSRSASIGGGSLGEISNPSSFCPDEDESGSDVRRHRLSSGSDLQRDLSDPDKPKKPGLRSSLGSFLKRRPSGEVNKNEKPKTGIKSLFGSLRRKSSTSEEKAITPPGPVVERSEEIKSVDSINLISKKPLSSTTPSLVSSRPSLISKGELQGNGRQGSVVATASVKSPTASLSGVNSFHTMKKENAGKSAARTSLEKDDQRIMSPAVDDLAKTKMKSPNLATRDEGGDHIKAATAPTNGLSVVAPRSDRRPTESTDGGQIPRKPPPPVSAKPRLPHLEDGTTEIMKSPPPTQSAIRPPASSIGRVGGSNLQAGQPIRTQQPSATGPESSSEAISSGTSETSSSEDEDEPASGQQPVSGPAQPVVTAVPQPQQPTTATSGKPAAADSRQDPSSSSFYTSSEEDTSDEEVGDVHPPAHNHANSVLIQSQDQSEQPVTTASRTDTNPTAPLPETDRYEIDIDPQSVPEARKKLTGGDSTNRKTETSSEESDQSHSIDRCENDIGAQSLPSATKAANGINPPGDRSVTSSESSEEDAQLHPMDRHDNNMQADDRSETGSEDSEDSDQATSASSIEEEEEDYGPEVDAINDGRRLADATSDPTPMREEPAIPSQPITKPTPSQAITKPAPSQPITKPAPSQPITEPTPSQPITKPAPSQPIIEPTPSQPIIKPVPSQPITKPAPSQPITKPASSSSTEDESTSSEEDYESTESESEDDPAGALPTNDSSRQQLGRPPSQLPETSAAVKPKDEVGQPVLPHPPGQQPSLGDHKPVGVKPEPVAPKNKEDWTSDSSTDSSTEESEEEETTDEDEGALVPAAPPIATKGAAEPGKLDLPRPSVQLHETDLDDMDSAEQVQHEQGKMLQSAAACQPRQHSDLLPAPPLHLDQDLDHAFPDSTAHLRDWMNAAGGGSESGSSDRESAPKFRRNSFSQHHGDSNSGTYEIIPDYADIVSGKVGQPSRDSLLRSDPTNEAASPEKPGRLYRQRPSGFRNSSSLGGFGSVRRHLAASLPSVSRPHSVDGGSGGADSAAELISSPELERKGTPPPHLLVDTGKTGTGHSPRQNNSGAGTAAPQRSKSAHDLLVCSMKEPRPGLVLPLSPRPFRALSPTGSMATGGGASSGTAQRRHHQRMQNIARLHIPIDPESRHRATSQPRISKGEDIPDGRERSLSVGPMNRSQALYAAAIDFAMKPVSPPTRDAADSDGPLAKRTADSLLRQPGAVRRERSAPALASRSNELEDEEHIPVRLRVNRRRSLGLHGADDEDWLAGNGPGSRSRSMPLPDPTRYNSLAFLVAQDWSHHQPRRRLQRVLPEKPYYYETSI